MSRVLVIGDVMLDHYVEGQATRLSPEAPVPVVHVKGDRFVLGGAANVAANVMSLGGKAILIGVVGEDGTGHHLMEEARQCGIDTGHMLSESTRPTTEKCRIMSDRHQIARYDREDSTPIGSSMVARLEAHIRKLDGAYDAVVISDYGKGFILPNVFNQVGLLNDVPTVVDPKHTGFQTLCPTTGILKPNKSEAEAELQMVIHDPREALVAVKALHERTGVRAVYLTLGEWGGALASLSGAPRIIPTCRVSVYDPTGAGDTTAAALALELAEGKGLEEACRNANLAGAAAVRASGTVTVSWDQVREMAAVQ